MSSISVRNLGEEFSFGAVVTGVTFETLSDETVRCELNEVFDRRGLIVFEGVE